MKKAFLHATVYLLFTLILPSCSSNESFLSGLGAQTILNPTLSGRFFFEQGNKAYFMDLSSGSYTEIPNTGWEAQGDRFPYGVAQFSAKPSTFGDELLAVTVDNCKSMPGGSLSSMSCIAVQDFSGNYKSQFDVDYDAVGGKLAAEFSPDGKYLALFRRDGVSTSIDLDLEVYDWEKRELISSWTPQERPSSFEWLPDGRIVYAVDRTLVFTKTNSAESDYTLTLPDSMGEAHIGYLAVSPNGKEIAFTMITDSTLVSVYGELFTVNVDTLNIRKIAQVAGRESMIRQPKWSPDGKWIAVLEGGADGFGLFSPGAPSDLYAIPINTDQNKPFTLSREDKLRSSGVLRLQRYLSIENDQPGDSITMTFPNWDFYWLQ